MRFDISDNITNATPEVKLLYDGTDNPSFYTSEGTEPTVDEWLLGFTISARQAMKVEIGLAKADRSGFVSSYAVHLPAGGLYRFDSIRALALLTMSAALVNKLALKITPVADATPAAVAGDIFIGMV